MSSLVSIGCWETRSIADELVFISCYFLWNTTTLKQSNKTVKVDLGSYKIPAFILNFAKLVGSETRLFPKSRVSCSNGII